MIASEAIVKILEKEGITDAFGIPGAGINGLYKHLEKAPIKHYLMRHEEAAVHAADAYYRASGRLALAICTSGPGATNFVTGIYTAWIDSIPLIAVTGQANSALLGKGAFQCADIAEIVKPVAKRAWRITGASAIPSVFHEAFETARSGRPGPVLIDLPLDMQLAEINFSIDSYTPSTLAPPKPDKTLIAQAVKLLDEAKKPVIIMGGGVILAKAEKALIDFAEFMNIPVISTYMAKGGMPEDHPLYAGQMGIQTGAVSSGNDVFLASDLALGIGCRFTDRHTGAVAVYQGERKFIHIDIDRKEIGKIIKTELGIHADASEALTLLLEAAHAAGNKRTRPNPDVPFKYLRKKYQRQPNFSRKTLDPREVYELVNRAFNDDTIFTTGCGLTQIWSGQYQRINKPRKYLPSGGAGTLGFDIPAAIGASVATKKGKAVAIMGDFGFTFLVEELAVASRYELPVVVIIINNAYLSLIRQNQKYAYQYEYEVAMKENKGLIDYVKVSEGLGCTAQRVFSYEEGEKALARAAAATGTYVVEFIVDDATDCDMGNDIAHIRHFD
ncbi:MAG: glyoxylate carboligase [Treponema sp.]|nr:glyoxylate carboligase [Treponema sp.]